MADDYCLNCGEQKSMEHDRLCEQCHQKMMEAGYRGDRR